MYTAYTRRCDVYNMHTRMCICISYIHTCVWWHTYVHILIHVQILHVLQVVFCLHPNNPYETQYQPIQPRKKNL